MADKCIILHFLWILRHTSRLKPLFLRTQLAEPFTTNKALLSCLGSKKDSFCLVLVPPEVAMWFVDDPL